MKSHETYGIDCAAHACNDSARGGDDPCGLCKTPEARFPGWIYEGIEDPRGCDGLKCSDSDKARAASGTTRLASVTMCAELNATDKESVREHRQSMCEHAESVASNREAMQKHVSRVISRPNTYRLS